MFFYDEDELFLMDVSGNFILTSEGDYILIGQ